MPTSISNEPRGVPTPSPNLPHISPPQKPDASQKLPGSAPYPDFDDHDILRRPWTHIGYRGLSRVIASDKNFLIARRFGVLSARVILFLQDEIVALETRLDNIDRENSRKDVGDIDNGTFRHDGVEGRKEILEEIYQKLKDYYEYLNTFALVADKPVAGRRNASSLRFWLYHLYDRAIANDEADFIQHSDDLFALAPKYKSPIRVALERIRWFQLKFFRTDMPDPTYQDPAVILQDDVAVDRFAAAIIGGLGIVFLVAPLWILNAVSGINVRLGIITGFLMLFMLLVTLGTTARPFESLGAAAAYAAVLMVFLQVNSGKPT